MTNQGYSDQVLKHFRQPKNLGKIKNPNGMGKVGNLVCGDVMYLYIRVVKNKIQAIGFETFGCVAAIATSSAVTELAKGKTIDQALKINKDQVIKLLGGLPKLKIHCSLLALDALNEAIYNYLEKTKQPISQALEQYHQQMLKQQQILKQKFGH